MKHAVGSLVGAMAFTVLGLLATAHAQTSRATGPEYASPMPGGIAASPTASTATNVASTSINPRADSLLSIDVNRRDIVNRLITQ